MVAGQRRDCDRRPRQPVQRIRLPQDSRARARRRDAGAAAVPDRLRPRLRRPRASRLDHAGTVGRRPRRARRLCAGGCRLPPLRRQLHQQRARGPAGRCRLGRRGGRLRRRRPGHRRGVVERRPRDRSRRYVRHRDAERDAPGRAGARPVRPRAVRPRARLPRRRIAHRRRRHVRRSLHQPLARLRSRAHRLPVYPDGEARTDRRADDLRREGT